MDITVLDILIKVMAPMALEAVVNHLGEEVAPVSWVATEY